MKTISFEPMVLKVPTNVDLKRNNAGQTLSTSALIIVKSLRRLIVLDAVK